MNRWLLVIWSLVFFVFSSVPVSAQSSGLSVELLSDKEKVVLGEQVSYTMRVGNATTGELSDVVLYLDVPGDGLVFTSSDKPVEYQSAGRPVWRLGKLASGGYTDVNISYILSDKPLSSTLVAQASVGAKQDKNEVSSYSSQVAVLYDEPTKTEEKDQTQVAEKKDQETKPEESKEVVEKGSLKTDVIKKIDVKSFLGLIKTPEKQFNRNDSRFWILGSLAIVLIVAVGITSFFLGKKVK